MNFLDKLSSFPASRHKKKRLGRGKSSGHGGTSTKGHNGQRSRSGFSLLRGFEGGQMPLIRLLPKFGFTNKQFKVKYDIINLSDLNNFDKEVNPLILYKAGLVRKNRLVKVLSKGTIDKSLSVRAHHFSKTALEEIKKMGGTAELLPRFSHNKLIDLVGQKTGDLSKSDLILKKSNSKKNQKKNK